MSSSDNSNEHLFFHLPNAKTFLGNALAVECHTESYLPVPKAIAVGLFACVLLEEYIDPIRRGLVQLMEDIHSRYERSPDAKSLQDFRGFVLSLAHQVKHTLDPIHRLATGCGELEMACTNTRNALTDLANSVNLHVRCCADQLVILAGDEPYDGELGFILYALSEYTIEERKRQEPLVRSTLDLIQTVVKDCLESVDRNLIHLRVGQGCLRKSLQKAEQKFNVTGS